MPRYVLREQPRNEVKSKWPLPKKIAIWAYHTIVPWIVYCVATLLASTYRWRQMVSKELLELMSSGKPFAVAIWHGDMLLSQSLGKRLGWNNRTVVMVALNQAGEVEARILKRLGYYVVRGSAKKRGKEALEDMKDILGQGAIAAMVVDGPLGPAREVKAGVVELARFCQVPIVPVAFLPGNEWIIPTWDRTRIPKPFSRCITTSTIPIRVPHNVGGSRFEKIREDIKEVLIDLEERKVTWHQALSLAMDLLSVFGARHSILRIEEALAGVVPGRFAKDKNIRSYVQAELKGIGTELKKVNKKYYKNFKLEIDWKRFYETQEVILDTCGRGDPQEIWNLVRETIPGLKKDIEAIIDGVPLWNISKIDVSKKRPDGRSKAADSTDSGRTRKAGNGRI
jgi:lysophospholipid acyltransferase (LPLAT)-like uncharacterized protein/uncharacterized protein with HEPN domain